MLLLNKNQSRTNKAGTLISIHLMLLLNVLQGCINIQCGHFNTSYVVIKLLQVHLEHLHRCHFNTSYVVIKRVKDYGFDPAQSFQYILCCY